MHAANSHSQSYKITKINVHNIGQVEARHTRYEKDLNCAAVKITTAQVTNLLLP
jgi:hypothetical protein